MRRRRADGPPILENAKGRVNPEQFLEFVIVRTLRRMAQRAPRVDSDVARALLLGTALAESGLVYLRQVPNGPALGVYQMEPATHFDLFESWLNYRPDWYGIVTQFSGPDLDAFELVGNLPYATACARAHYWRVAEPLPKLEAAGLAAYHKRHFNTAAGRADVRDTARHFARAIHLVVASH